MDHKNIQKENELQLNTSNHAIEILETEKFFFCYVLLLTTTKELAVEAL